jgi:cyclase
LRTLPPTDSERIVGNLHRAYHDLDQGRAEPDRFAALADMVACNGRHPLSCCA